MNLGSGNRGCEAIIRGTLQILNVPRSCIVLYDKNDFERDLDIQLGIDELAELRRYESFKNKYNPLIFFHKVLGKIGFDGKWKVLFPYHKMLQECNQDTPVFFTGGDLFCYPSTLKTNLCLLDKLSNDGVPTILWGSSVDVALFSSETIKQIRKISCIICRESYSYESLKKIGISNNLYLYPDPAFVLSPLKTPLSNFFNQSDIVGINVSNYVNSGFDINSLFGKNIEKMMTYILNSSQMQILLIPHVTWNDQDDRIICRKIYEKFKSTGRVHLLDIDKLSYCEIRYIISNCRFFFGARTHSVISAYATCVPTVALGYSIKSRGIAHDLGLDKSLVVNCNELDNEKVLIDAFIYLHQHEAEIKEHLKTIMPSYIRKAHEAKNAVVNIIEN